jgi:multiple sugar transport system permease protein/fructooligosaccharide transport system permease protein
MKRILFWIISIGVSFFFLAPLLWMIQGAFLPEEIIFKNDLSLATRLSEASFDNFADAWRRTDMGRALLNSTIQLLGIIGLGLFFNSMAAFAFARFNFKGRNLLFSAVVALIILPVEVIVIPLFLTAKDLQLTGGTLNIYLALILPFSAKAMNIFFLRQHFMMLPQAQEEAALMDGASWFRIYFSIALPSIKPALATLIVLDGITHWSDFIWPLVVCTRNETRTVQIAMANLFTQPPVQWGDILACAVLLTLPVLALFSFAQRHIVLTEMDASEK